MPDRKDEQSFEQAAKQLSPERDKSLEYGTSIEAIEQKELKKGMSEEIEKGIKKRHVVLPQTNVASQHAAKVVQEADEELKLIENILAEGMEDIYKQLPPAKQQEFKTKGEETAQKIKKIINSVKIKTKKIVGYIIEWLKVIPHVNKFFLRQEAKLKTDRIIKYIDDKKNE